MSSASTSSSGSVPQRAFSDPTDKVWPPRASDHDNRRLATNVAGFTLFGWGVKATQMAILMETKLAHYTPEMKAITRKKWFVPSVYIKSAAVWAPIGYIYYWARLRVSYLLAQKQRDLAQVRKRTFIPPKRSSEIELDGLPM